MTPIISHSPAYGMGKDALWEKSTLEQDFSTQQISSEWIQNLSPEQKEAALLRFCSIVESQPTLVESFALNQVLYRTLTGNSFTESAESVAQRTGHDRKTILKGLNQAVEQNILEENKRPGTSNEYSFKPVEEWLPQPVVHNKDTQKIEGDNLVQFPTQTNVDIVETEPVHNTDDHETDTNMLLFNNLLEEQQQLEVSVSVEDTPKSTPWKYVGQGIPRVYVPPELDQDTGMKIESIHTATNEPRSFIIKNAVDLLYNQLQIPSVELEQNNVTISTIPNEVLQALTEAGIHLNLVVAERLWLKYSERFSDALAYTIQQSEAGKIKQSREGFFRKSLEEGWSFSKPQSNNKLQKPVSTSSLTEEQLEWYLWAVREGICLPAAINELPIKMGRVCAKVQIANPRPFDPPYDLRPIEELMREFPM